MSRYIDVEKAMGWAKEELSHNDKEIIEVMIEEIPTADVQEVRHGRWIKVDKGVVECSCCHTITEDYETNRFCSWCGAIMDGGYDNGKK